MCYSERLTLQQKTFCNEYLVSFNAYRAALNAGYSESTARKGQLLHLAEVQLYLKNAIDKRALRLEITHDMILQELAKVAFSSVGNYYDDFGELKPIYELTADERAALSHYENSHITEEDGFRIGKNYKIRLHNKMAALEKIAKHLGFYGVNKKQEPLNQKQESRSKNQEGILAGSLKEEVGSEEVEPIAKNQEVLSEDREIDLMTTRIDGHIDENGRWVEMFVEMPSGGMPQVMSVKPKVIEPIVAEEDPEGQFQDVIDWKKILTFSPVKEESRGKNQESKGVFVYDTPERISVACM